MDVHAKLQIDKKSSHIEVEEARVKKGMRQEMNMWKDALVIEAAGLCVISNKG